MLVFLFFLTYGILKISQQHLSFQVLIFFLHNDEIVPYSHPNVIYFEELPRLVKVLSRNSSDVLSAWKRRCVDGEYIAAQM